MVVEEEEKHPADKKEDKNSAGAAGEEYKIQRDRFDFFDPSLPVFPIDRWRRTRTG
jgi:hypothetical protein